MLPAEFSSDTPVQASRVCTGFVPVVLVAAETGQMLRR